MFLDTPLYEDNHIHPEDKKALDQITEPRKWDSQRFRSVLISLGTLNSGISIPSYNRPDQINIDGWDPVIMDLEHKTLNTKLEHARVLFVDTKKQKLLFSPKIDVGTKTEVESIITPPDITRLRDFRFIGMVHTHPSHDLSFYSSHGFSDQDYMSFLVDNRFKVSMISYGVGTRLLMMKTSVTPNRLNKDDIGKRLEVIKKEFMPDLKSIPDALLGVLRFNKNVCLEFGLTLFASQKGNNKSLNRVEVTSDV